MDIGSISKIISEDGGLEVGDIVILKKEEGDLSEVLSLRLGQLTSVPNTSLEVITPSDYGDSKESKVCNRCHKILPVASFPKNQNGKGDRSVRRPSCSSCRKVIDGKGVSAAQKRAWEVDKPHLVEFECPLCAKLTIPGLTSKVVLDHNHTTGVPVAWLCDSCNTGLGRFGDDPDAWKNVLAYLDKFHR